ncbi:hypothetical protein ACSFA3_20665 [Variovorax sp. RHLX14]|uniref:hypothetical protein n=1 Tax=Variovorax sp. RHLX14 TaxID=1259731 RepID=UPI003F46B32E
MRAVAVIPTRSVFEFVFVRAMHVKALSRHFYFFSSFCSGEKYRRVAYSQQGIMTSSQQSLSQQGEAAKAVTDASAKIRTAKSFFIQVLKVRKQVIQPVASLRLSMTLSDAVRVDPF